MTKLKTLLPIKVLSVFMAILMIFSTMSIMFTVSALTRTEGGGEGTWVQGTVTQISGQKGTTGSGNYGSYSGASIEYSVYLPKNYTSYEHNEPGKKLAVMVVMSGGGAYFNTNATNGDHPNNSGEDSKYAMARSTGLNYLADEMGIILIYFRQSNSDINTGYYWNFFRSSDQGRATANYMLPKLIATVDDIKQDYKKYIDDDTHASYITSGMSATEKDQYNRTYITGISAGGAQTASLISVYPEEFAGAAIVAGLPYKMLQDNHNTIESFYAAAVNNQTPTDATAIKAYQAAMDGSWPDYYGKTVQYIPVGSNYGSNRVNNYKGQYPSYETLAGYITSAWSTANSANYSDFRDNKADITTTAANAPRVIVLQGGKDKVVHPKNGRLTAQAFAEAMGVHDDKTLNVNVSNANFVNSVDGDINGKGYTVHYYGTDSSTKKTSDGYSQLAASQVVYYQFDDVAHQWVNRYADGFYSTKPSYANQNTNADYNQLMWEFFEGDNTPENVVTPEDEFAGGTETTTLFPTVGALFGIKQDRGPDNNDNGQVYDSEFKITGMDLVSSQGLKVTTSPLAYSNMASTTLQGSENDGLWNFVFDIQGLCDEKAAQYPNKDVRIVSISVKQNVWNQNYGSPMLCMSYAVVDTPTLTTTNAVKGQDANRIDVLELSPSNENDLLSGTITDAKDLEALKNGYLNVVTFDSAYGSNHNVAAPVIEVKFEYVDKADGGDENDTPVTGDPTTTKTTGKLFPIYAYNSAAGYNAVEAKGYETKTYSGDVANLAAGAAGHLTGTAKKYSVGVYNAADTNDTIYYSFNLSDYTKNNGYTIKSVTINYTLEGNPYYSKKDVGVNVLLSGNQYWEIKTDAPAKNSMVNVESHSLAKGEKIEGEITFSAQEQSKLINYINNLGGFTIAFENTAENPHYYFLATMPTITVVYEQATNADVQPGAITGVGIRTDNSYSDRPIGNVPTEGTISSTITVGSGKSYYSTSYNNTGAFDENAANNGNNAAILTSFDIYAAALDEVIADIKANNKGVSDSDITNIQITIDSATFNISGKNTSSGWNGSSYSIYGNYSKTPQSDPITSGGQLAADSTTNAVSVEIAKGNYGTATGNTNVAMSGFTGAFTEETPYLWTKVAGSNDQNSFVNVPTITNLKVSYTATIATIIEPDGPATGSSGSGDAGETDITISALSPTRPLGTTSNTGADAAGTMSVSTAITGNNLTNTSSFEYRAVVADFNIYKAAYDYIVSYFESEYGFTEEDIETKVSDLVINFKSVDVTQYAKRSGGNNTHYARLYYSTPTASNSNLTNFTTNSTGKAAWTDNAWGLSNNNVQPRGPVTITFGDDMQFSESNPWLLMRAYGTRAGYGTYYYTYVSVPQLSNLQFDWSAKVDTSGKPVVVNPILSADASNPLNGLVTVTVTTDASFKYVKLSNTVGDIILSDYTTSDGVNVFKQKIPAPIGEDVTYTVTTSEDGSAYVSNKTGDVSVTVKMLPGSGSSGGSGGTGGGTNSGEPYNVDALSIHYNTSTSSSSNMGTSNWKNNATNKYTSGNVYSLIMNYDFDDYVAEIEENLKATLKPETGKIITGVKVTLKQLVITGSAYSSSTYYPKVFYVTVNSSEYSTYNNVLTNSSTNYEVSGNPYTATIDLSKYDLTGKVLTVFARRAISSTNVNSNYAFTSIPTATITYDYEVYTEDIAVGDPITDVSGSVSDDGKTLSFNVKANEKIKYVKITTAENKLIGIYETNGATNLVLTSDDVPKEDTTYYVYGGMSVTEYDEENYKQCSVTGIPDPLQSFDHRTTDTQVIFSVVTAGAYKYVKVVNNSTNAEYIVNQYTANGRFNSFVVEAPAPENNTTYNVYVSKDGNTYSNVTLTCDVKGNKITIEDRVINAVGNFFTNLETGRAETITGETYDDVRVITTTSSTTGTDTYNYEDLGSTVSGYIVGTNKNYYVENNDNYYYTGTRRNTGSPSANTAIKAGYNTFPVSYLGYAYINYDLSESFAKVKPATEGSYTTITDNNGIKVEERTRTETVISDIKVSYVKAQEGYVGGWANRYTVSGSSFVTGGSKVANGAKLPTGGYQSLGNGDVSTSMANIGASASLNSQQMADAKNGENVTVWVENTGCDWNSRYFSSAWLLVEVPVVTVTYKTITYTDKKITETKSVAAQPIVTKSDVTEGATQSQSITTATGGYLVGRGYGAGNTYRYQTVSPSSNQLATESNYNAQSNVNLQTNRNAFAVTYLGKGYVLYDLTSVKGTEDRDTISTEIEKRYIDGKFVDVEIKKERVSTTTISGITVSGSMKAGFQANSGTSGNNANSYNITNMVYALGSTKWTGNSGNNTNYPSDESAWQALNVVYGIKKDDKTYTGNLNEETIADVLKNGYLTVRIDNCFNDWQSGGTLSNAYVAAWTLATIPTVEVQFSTMEYIETTVTPKSTNNDTSFNPTFEVYAQYNFISADGEILSKTKLMGTMEGYGASAEVVPYIVDPVSGVDENGQEFVNHGLVTNLYSNGKLVEGKSVEISMDASRKDKYVLKDAYIEDVNTEIAQLAFNGNNTYTLTTTLDKNIKTNDTYKVRIIFDYYMEEASEPVTENSVDVNLHAHFLDSNGNEVGNTFVDGFASLHNSSYILSLDDVKIPYGDIRLPNGMQVSAVFGSNQIYKFDSTKTQINIANATGGVVSGTNNTEASTSDYLAKAYLDIGNDNVPSAGDILVVTYNGKNETSGQEIDVHLYYIEEPMYTFDVNYEFRIEGSFGETAGSKTETLENQTFYKGSIVLPYDLLGSEGEDYSKVVIDGYEYNISDFNYTIETNGVELNGNEVVSASGSNPSVTYVYTYKDKVHTRVDATVQHKYVINGVVNGVSTTDTVYLPNTSAVLGNPADSAVKALHDNSAVVSTKFGTFKASDFVVSGIDEVTDYGVTFKAYDHANGKYPTDFVPHNVTEIATIEITYTLQVHEIKVVETFTQNGTTQVNYKETFAYIPNNGLYTFNSSFGANFEPANDGVKLSAYTVDCTGANLTNSTPGSVSFSVVGLTGDMTVYINYDYATSVDVTVENEFYINNTKLPADALVGVIPGTTEFTLAKDATEVIALATGKVVYNGTEFNVSDFAAAASTNYAGINVTNGNVISATLNKHNGSTATITVRYDLTVYAVNVTEVFTKDGVEVARKSTTAYIKADDDYTFTSTYKTGSIISDVALGDYIRTAQGATVTTAGNGAATFTVTDIAANTNVTINYAVSTKTTANVEYVYIVNDTVVNDATLVDGVSTMNLVYNKAVSAPSSTGGVTLAGDYYSINAFEKTVTVSGAATAAGNDVTLNAYNVANGAITVTVTYELTVRTKADVAINHKYFINNVELTGSAIAGVTAGTGNLTLDYNVSQTIDKSTGTVNYNGTEFNLSQFDVSVVDVNSNVLSVNGLDVKLIKYNVGDQTITVRYDLTVYTVVVNEIFYINGTEAKTVSNTYYVSAEDDATLRADLTTTPVDDIAVSDFIVSVPASGEIVDGKYIASVNSDDTVTITYNVSTKTNVNITSIFKVNDSADGVDTTYVTNATATQTVEYGVSTAITLAGGYVIWNGTQFNVSDFRASITSYDAETIAASGLNVTLNKYNADATNIVITYELTARSVTLTENFIVDGSTAETQVTTKWYVDGAEYTFESNYGSSYEPVGTSIALSNFNMSSDCGATRYGDKAQFTGVADADKTAAINYTVVTKAPVVKVTHKYFFNGVEIESGLNITAQGDTQTSLTYGVSTSIKVSEGTYTFTNNGNETVFDLSGANVDIVVTSESDVTVEGTNVTLNSYNPTAIELTVNYYLTTVVVNITEVITTDDGENTKTETHTFYLLDGDTFGTFESSFENNKVMMNGVEIPYSLFNRTVTGADNFEVVYADSAVIIKGITAGQGGDITITYSGVKTTGTIQIAELFGFKATLTAQPDYQNKKADYAPPVEVSVGDRVALKPDRDISLTVGNVTQTVHSSYFYVDTIESTSFGGYVDLETNEFVITSITPNSSDISDKIVVKWCVNMYDDVEVIHEFYVNNKLFTSIEEIIADVPVVGTGTTGSKYMIGLKESGTISANGTSYNIKTLTSNGSLVLADVLIKETSGLVVRRGTTNSLKNKYGIYTMDFTVEDKQVVLRYDITTTLEEVNATVNSTYVNNGEYVGELSNSVVTNIKIGDVIANETVKTINGIDVTFAVQSVVGNGVTITNENGVYTITEIDPKATEWSIDITYVAAATASVKLTHEFFVAGKHIGTITDNAVLVNLANHSGKFAALSGIVGVTTDEGIVYVDASRFTVSVEDNACGTLADRIFTLNAGALDGSTYNVVLNYSVDGISYVVDGEVGIKQTASAIDVKGQYNVVTTITSVGNTRPIDLIFVVDVSAGANGDNLMNAKAAISKYITDSFALNNNVRVAIVTYADGYELLTDSYITDKDTALAIVESIQPATAKDGYDVTASNLQAGLYGARTFMNANVSTAYTDVIVFKSSDANAAYSMYNAESYNYSDKIDATADEANAGAEYELEKMNASKEIVIDLATETNLNATMTQIFDERNYINVNAEAYITINVDDFTFVTANGVKVNGNGDGVDYSYDETTGLISIRTLGTLKGEVTIEYTLEIKNKAEDGDYFVSDTSSDGIRIVYQNSIRGESMIARGVSARVNYNTTTTGGTITVITYHANSELKPIGLDGLTIKYDREDAIIGQPIVYTISGVTNLTAGTTYDVKAPIVSGYTLCDGQDAVQTVTIPAEGDNVVVYFGYYASGEIVDDSIVYDDSSAIVFDVLSNDARPTGETFTAIYGIGLTAADAEAGKTDKVSTTNGDLIIVDGGRVRFAPNGITVTTEFYYSVKDGDKVRVAKIYIVPATIVKGDVTSAQQVTVGDRWTVVYDDIDDTPVADVDNVDIIYGGHKENDDGEYGFDNNSALLANRYQDYNNKDGKVDVSNDLYTVSFTFTGTGFDIISVTGSAGGYMRIMTKDSAGKTVAKASGDISTFAKTNNIYQATVFTCTDLAWDTYTVEVTALRTYIPRIGMTDTQVYVDSVRTYNPFAGNTNEHYNDLHNGSTTETLKDIFVDGNLAVSTGGNGGNGLFTPSGNLNINSYMDNGTNNAINIIAGQSLLFKLDDASARTTFQVEMAAVDRKATVNVKVNSKLVETLELDTGVFAYYDFSKYIRENSTVNFEVVEGQITFSKVRYNNATLGEPIGEKYTTDDLATGTAPDAEKMSDAYTINTARLVRFAGTSRTITALVYTSTNANSVVVYAGGYRIVPASITKTVNTAGTQNLFTITFEIPAGVSAGAVAMDFYAYDTSTETYSSNYKSATYVLQEAVA